MNDFVTNTSTVVKDSAGRIVLIIADTLSGVSIGETIPEGTLGWDKNSGSISRYVSGSWVTTLVQSGITGDLTGNVTGAATGNAVINGVSTQDKIIREVVVNPTIAQINSGAFPVLAAVAGQKYRLVSAQAVAIGGNIDAVTTVDLQGVQGASNVKLVAFTQAALTQSALIRDGASGGTILADGASYTACDVETAWTIENTGNNITTGTSVLIKVQYVVVAA